MVRMNFESALRYKEENFITFKKNFGHRYESQTYHLLDFDRFCVSEFPDLDTLTEEMVMKWAVIKPTENSNGYISRISVVRQLGKYLAMLGEEAFILPEGLKGGDMPLMPYVFTPESLKAFWNYTDSMERYYQSTVRHLVAPVMFRYMYCCGLRPVEARRLKRNDIDFKTGRIFISESKYNKERIIYAPDPLINLTRNYLGQIVPLFPDSEALFVDRKGDPISQSVHQYLFEHCRDGSGINALGTKTPSLYSFRHSRAMHLYRNGMSLQLLAEFMGHASVVSTQIYAYADTEMKRKALEKCQTKVDKTSKEVPEWQIDEDMIKKLYGLV